MSRLSNAILSGNSSIASGHKAPMLDPIYGGQQGFVPDYTQWVSNQSYLRRNIFCILLEAPKAFQKLNDGGKHVGILKSLVELHPLSIDGLSATVSVETAETAVGGSGQMMEHFTNVTEARSNPVFKWDEKYGRPVQSFLRNWVTMLMMDPHSKVAGIGMTNNRPEDMLADMYSATMAFIEPDPTHTKVVQSWICANMFPKDSIGDVVGRRDLTQGGELTSYDITFSALTQYGVGVDAFCQNLLDSINITGANPYYRNAFVNSIGSDVSAQSVGYKSQAENAAAQSVHV